MSRSSFSSSSFSAPAPFSFASVGLPESQALAIWAALRRAIGEIQSGNASKLRFEELYRNSYTLVLHKYGDLLYKGLEECLAENLEVVGASLASVAREFLLLQVSQCFDRHKLTMSMIRDILMYLDKTFIDQQKLLPVYELGLAMFREKIVKQLGIAERLRPIILENIQKEREGGVIDRGLLKNILSMFVELNSGAGRSSSVCLAFYHSEFEKEFLLQTRIFFQQESQLFIAQNSIPEYLKKVEARLKEEEGRADAFLDKSSRHKLRAIIQEELIIRYARQIISDPTTGASKLFELQQLDDLNRLFLLFSLCSKDPTPLEILKAAMCANIKKHGEEIISDQENLKNPTQFIQQMLDFHRKYKEIVENSFQNDRIFLRALKETLEYFINLDSRAAQYLSLYLDDLFYSGRGRGLSDREVEEKFQACMEIFRFLQDKDIFEDFYKQHLANRLLTGNSANSEWEKLFIGKLKTESGHQFTSRLEGMFRDVEMSKVVTKDFLASRRRNEAAPEVQFSVLTTGFWPLANNASLDLRYPEVLSSEINEFQRFYSAFHTGRRLQWFFHLGAVEVRCRFEAGRKEFLLHPFQALILLNFNSGETFTVSELLQATNLPEGELHRHLLSLAHPNVRVLKKTPNVKAIAADHKFSFNHAYTSKLYRNKIPVLSKAVVAGDSAGSAMGGSEDSTASDSAVPPAVLEGRKNRVDASVVRIMKARKTLDHNALIAEVAKQLTPRFPVDGQFVKKRIENLIEREYLARDQENRRLYHYLA